MASDTPACVITGASTGIGAACAARLDRAGWRVFAGVRREADAQRLGTELSGRARILFIDVTDERAIAAAAREVEAAVGPAGLHGLVNNAGIAVAAPLESLPIAKFREQLEVNVVGQLAVTQAFLPMLRRAAGRLVLMGSVGGRFSTPFLGPYCASKFALEAMADALRVELQPWNVQVSIVEPGSIATPIWGKGAAIGAEISAQVPRDVAALYEPAMAAMQKAAAATGQRGIPADAVAAVVEHALVSTRPKTRYLVGNDARLRARLSAFVPDRVRDLLITRAIKLPRRGAFAERRA